MRAFSTMRNVLNRSSRYLLLFAFLILTADAQLQKVEVSGRGAAFPGPLYRDWTFYFRFVDHSTLINYHPTDSGDGRAAILAEEVDFGGSDIPLDDGERVVAGGALVMFPTVLAPLGFAYSSQGLPAGIVFSRRFLVRLYAGGKDVRLPFWDDEELVAVNPALDLPHERIKLFVRTEAHGEVVNIKTALRRMAEADDMPFEVSDPHHLEFDSHPDDVMLLGGPSSDMLTMLQQTPYVIGFMIGGDIDKYGLRPIGILNKAGTVVYPSSKYVKHVAQIAPIDDFFAVSTLDVAPDRETWPMTVATYVLMKRNTFTENNDCAVPRTLVRFFVWTQTNELAINVASGLGGALSFEVTRKVVHMLEMNVTCNGRLASEGTFHVLLGGGSLAVAPLEKLSPAYELIEPKRPLHFSLLGSRYAVNLLLKDEMEMAVVETPIDDEMGFDSPEAVRAAGITQVPFFAGPLVVAYNLEGFEEDDVLSLSMNTIHAIFSGRVTRWDDSVIRRDNRQLIRKLPASNIQIVVTFLASGITESFTTAMVRHNPNFPPGAGTLVDWPANVVSMEEAVDIAQYVLDHPNTITFLDMGTAVSMHNLIANMINVNGEVLKPDIATIRAAALGFENNNFKRYTEQGAIPAGASLSNSPNPEAWPLIATSYAVFHTVTPLEHRCEPIEHAANFLAWAVTSPEAYASIEFTLSVPIPISLAPYILEHIANIKCAYEGSRSLVITADTGCPITNGVLCGNGKCVVDDGTTPNTIACECFDGWQGVGCDIEIETIESNIYRDVGIGVGAAAAVGLVVLVMFFKLRERWMRPPVWMVPRVDVSLEKLLARGGNALVFLATWKATTVAAKVVPLRSRQNTTGGQVDVEEILVDGDAMLQDEVAMAAAAKRKMTEDYSSSYYYSSSYSRSASSQSNNGRAKSPDMSLPGTVASTDSNVNSPGKAQGEVKSNTTNNSRSHHRRSHGDRSRHRSRNRRHGRHRRERERRKGRGRKGGDSADLIASSSIGNANIKGGKGASRSRRNAGATSSTSFADDLGKPLVTDMARAQRKNANGRGNNSYNVGRSSGTASGSRRLSTRISSTRVSSSWVRNRKVNAATMNEVTVISKLRHPNVVFMIAACIHNDFLYLLLEHVEGGSLYDVLRNDVLELDPSVRVRIALDTAKGVLFLHQQDPPVLHMDLKTPNVLVDSHLVAKITDFGLSSIRPQVVHEGTMAWTPPEVLAHEIFNLASDVYSFGIIMWELQQMTASHPWPGKSPMEIRDAVLDGERPRIDPAAGKPLGIDYEALLIRCWDQDPERRPTMQMVVRDLEKMLEHADKLDQARGKDARSQLLLLDLPASMRNEITRGAAVTPVPFSEVTAVYCDVVEEASLATREKITADLIELHEGEFQSIILQHHGFHLETIGTAYIAVTNFPRAPPNGRQAEEAVRMALKLARAAKNAGLKVKIGVHCGPAVATIVGTTNQKLALLGDTVSYSSRLEECAPVGRVIISRATHALIRSNSGFRISKVKSDSHTMGDKELMARSFIVKDYIPDSGHIKAPLQETTILEDGMEVSPQIRSSNIPLAPITPTKGYVDPPMPSMSTPVTPAGVAVNPDLNPTMTPPIHAIITGQQQQHEQQQQQHEQQQQQQHEQQMQQQRPSLAPIITRPNASSPAPNPDTRSPLIKLSPIQRDGPAPVPTQANAPLAPTLAHSKSESLSD